MYRFFWGSVYVADSSVLQKEISSSILAELTNRDLKVVGSNSAVDKIIFNFVIFACFVFLEA